MNTQIQQLTARRIWDSRGRPTVEAEVRLANGQLGRGMAPAGASRGSREATDLRDGGAWLGGWDVSQAVAQVNGPIAQELRGRDAMDQAAIDQALIELDGTTTMSKLGGNASIAVSMAVLQAAAASTGQPLWQHLAQGRAVRLPLPEVQIFGGGAHAGRRVDIQDFLIMPIGAQSFDEAMVMVARVYYAAGDIMQQRGRRSGVADEGGWWPDFNSNEEALETLVLAIEKSGLGFDQVAISLDIAASEFGRQGRYTLGLEQRSYDTDGWLEVLTGWVNKYPILSIEDPVAEDDTVGMQRFMQAVGHRIQVIGDDYLVTREELVRQALSDRACNAVLIKPNQVGTITQAHRAMELAREAGWGQVVSARSGETEDTIIVHLATGWNTGQLKVGSFARSERMAKWNEGLRIESALGAQAVYAGRSALPQGIHWAP